MRKFILRSTGDLGNMLFEWALIRRLAGDEPATFYWDPAQMNECELERIGLPIERMPDSLRPLTPISATCGRQRRLLYPLARRMGRTLPIVSDTYRQLTVSAGSHFPKGAFVQGRFHDCGQVTESTRTEIREAVNGQLLTKTAVPSGILGVHIRRGDYMDEYWRSRLGLLSEEYFDRAIQSVELQYSEIRIFTDSPDNEVVNQLAAKWGGSVRRNSTRYEDMWEMSQCDALIISNSTFSLWAALLGGDSIQEVVYPVPWVIKAPSPDMNCPSRWRRVSSTWS